jgi:hypothetical protein
VNEPRIAGSADAEAPQSSLQARRQPMIKPRFRAVALGLALVPALCWWSMRTEIISGGAELIEASLLLIVVFVLFVLTVLNDAVRRRWPSMALTQAELITVYVLNTTSVGVAGLGQIQFLNQALGGAFYFARPENHWQSTFHAYIPRWWVPNPEALTAYYKGNSTLFTAQHLAAWSIPVVVWTLFILVMMFGFLCLNTLFRRHWIEHERLSYPLTALPLELTRQDSARSLLRKREFWAAFLVTCIFRSFSGVHRLFPSFPDLANFGFKGQLIDLEPLFSSPPWNAIDYFRLSFHPLIIGITYFLPLDVAFSSWFFYLVVKGENIASAALGYHDAGASAAAAAVPYTGEQGCGAFLAIAVLTFWGARGHIKNVMAKAFSTRSDIDDSDEPLSYRTAVFGLIASFVALVAFTTCGGLPLVASVLFFALYLLMIVACTRFRAEAGPMLGYGPDMNPHEMLVRLPGTQAWDARSLTPLAYLQWFDSDYRTVAMPQQMEALKMQESTRLPARWLTKWILIAGLIACIASFISVLSIYYHYGAMTPQGDNDWRIYNGRAPFEILMNWIENPSKPDTTRLEWIGAGFAIAAGLVSARARFVWWPFHPVGFAMAQAGASLQWVWTAIMIGWTVKALILRYGGMPLYRKGVPIFLGLILGDVVICSLWSIVGTLMDAHMYMFFPG